MSPTFRLFVTATAITEMSSAALRPTIAPPSTTPVAGSERIFTKPRASPLISDFGFDGERHLRDPQLAARGERLGLGDADLGDLGIGEDRLRRLVVVEVAVRARGEPHHVLGDLAALHRRDRRQRQPARDVARRVDVRDVRLAVPVAGDVAAVVDHDARGVATELLGVRDRADREQRVRTVDRAAVVARDEDLVAFAADRGRARALQQLHAAPEELVLEHGRDLGILGRQHLLARHDQRHLRAERAEHVRELDAGHARADHDEVLGDLGRRVRLARREDALAVDRASTRARGAATRSRAGSRRPRSPRCRRRCAPRPVYAPVSRPVPRTRRTPCDSSRLVTPSRSVSSMPEMRLPERGNVEAAVGLQAHRVRAAELGQLVAGRDHRLARDAVPQVRGAADDVALDHRHFGAERRRDRRRGVAAGTATDDHETHGHDTRLRADRPA